MFREESVATTNVENDVGRFEDFGRIECPKEMIWMHFHSSGAETKKEPREMVITEVRPSFIQLPETPELTFVMPAQQPQ
jgi:hypothetical protein